MICISVANIRALNQPAPARFTHQPSSPGMGWQTRPEGKKAVFPFTFP